MQTDLAQLLCDNSMSGDLREGYSGRGMYGKTTHAVVFDSIQDFYSAIADIIDNSIADEDTDELEKLPRLFRDLKMDSMGTGIVIY